MEFDINTKRRGVKCPHCGKRQWRVRLYRSVDVAVNKDFWVLGAGYDLPEDIGAVEDDDLDQDSLFCDHCGFEPHKAEPQKKD